MNRLILLFCLILVASSVSAQKLPCLSLTAVDNPSIAYTQRGDRCEGFYQSPVGAESLTLVGLIYGTLRFDERSTEGLRISVPSTIKQEVHIQAAGIPLKTYYRLDAWIQPGEQFVWPLEIIDKMRLSPDNIGLVGISVAHPEFHVPLVIEESSCSSFPLTITLRSSADVGAVHWRVSDMNHEGQCGEPNNGWKKIEPDWGDRFVSGKGIVLSLLKQQENFCIEFATQTIGSANWLKLPLKILLDEE